LNNDSGYLIKATTIVDNLVDAAAMIKL